MYDELSDNKVHEDEVRQMMNMWRRLGVELRDIGTILDVGGAGGLHAPYLLANCKKYVVADIINYFSNDEGQLLPKLYSRLKRIVSEPDLRKLDFHNVDAQDLCYRDRHFDMVVSYNAFEHIPNPEKAFLEIARVAAPGAPVYIRFDPIWTSPNGSHFAQYVEREPWAHLVRSEAEFLEEMRLKGAPPNHADGYRTSMNRKPFSHYKTFFRLLEDMFYEKRLVEWWPRTEEEEPRAAHPNYARLRQQGYGVEDLVVRGFAFAGIRR